MISDVNINYIEMYSYLFLGKIYRSAFLLFTSSDVKTSNDNNNINCRTTIVLQVVIILLVIIKCIKYKRLPVVGTWPEYLIS